MEVVPLKFGGNQNLSLLKITTSNIQMTLKSNFIDNFPTRLTSNKSVNKLLINLFTQ